MSLYAIALRAMFVYLFILLIVRLSGKRTVARATPLDFIVALILGDMFDDLFWGDVSAAKFVAGTGAVMSMHILVSMASCLSPAIYRLVEGKPDPVVEKGAFRQDCQRATRLSPASLMAALRLKSIRDMREVKILSLEVSGQFGRIRREWAKPAEKQDLDRVWKALKKEDRP